ncbi:MAG TPA: glycosyltransferase [Candidatus Omnitrophica bacterium]|nr:glycosyltransferase [Candidatus Omnitrophota bacterium]
MKILFLVPYPTKGPSNRFRVQQYFPIIKKHDIDISLQAFQSERLYDILYSNGKCLLKVILLLQCALRRILCIFTVKRFDIVFIHREVFPFLGAFFVKIIHFLNPNIIYDFDDSIFLSHSNNSLLKLLRRPSAVGKIIALSRYTIAGNNYLLDYALKFNKNSIVIPTPIDTERFAPMPVKGEQAKVVIGWVGSRTTSGYLNILSSVFKELLAKFPNIEVHIIGGEYNFDHPRLIVKPWSLESEVRNLQSFDIGIMPLDDSKWTRGKCAFKIIQYMSVGIPVVASSVGMNKKVVNNTVNGFLVDNNIREWVDKLSLLINDRKLRKKMGDAGRITVQEKYSVKNNAPKLLDVIDLAAKQNGHK